MNENNIGLETSTKEQNEPLSDHVPDSNHIQCQKNVTVPLGFYMISPYIPEN